MSPLFLKQSTVSLTVWSNGMKPTPKSINFLEGSFVLINQPCLSSLILKWKQNLAKYKVLNMMENTMCS